jgi:hypothetical protein
VGSERLKILLSGMIAGVPRQGGASWSVLQYMLGLRLLGHDVVLVEPVDEESLEPAGAALERSAAAQYFRELVAELGIEDRAALLATGSEQTVGLSYAELRRVLAGADILLNVSGMLTDTELAGRIPVRVYLDLDPAFNQLWHDSGIDMRFDFHTHFATVGQAIGDSDCAVPDCGRTWIPTLPPVVLDRWPVAERLELDALTTVGHWRGYGSIEHEGRHYGQKAHSLRPLIELPTLTGARFVLALGIHPDETRDLEALARNGWELVDPLEVAGTPGLYQRFVQGSWAEFGIAKSGYVVSRSGWFSDRSACYLASGRPVVAQETGFSRFLPCGEGLLAFEQAEDVIRAIDALRADYGRHARAARRLAEEVFDSNRVLRRLIERVGAAS